MCRLQNYDYQESVATGQTQTDGKNAPVGTPGDFSREYVLRIPNVSSRRLKGRRYIAIVTIRR